MINEEQIINKISSQLRNFKRKTSSLYNFSCPSCGDSVKDKYKARGYFLKYHGDWLYKCHNCGLAINFPNFLKMNFPSEYQSYKFSKFKNNSVSEEDRLADIFKTKQTVSYEIDRICQRLDLLPEDHIALKYCRLRKIPKRHYGRIFYTGSLEQLKILFPKYEEEIKDEPRLVFPIFDVNKNLVGVSCRALSKKSKLRYIIMRKDEDSSLIYGLNDVNKSKPIFALEGAVDSLFIPNAVAVNGSDFSKLEKYFDKDNVILVFDNQPRNKIIVKKIKTMIENGWKVVIWPENFDNSGKDINQLVIDGISLHVIFDAIKNNVYHGLSARMKWSKWKKV